MWWREYYPRFPRSRPRAAKGGIKAQSKRGQFGQSWWAKRWISVLESFDIGARLGRGRSYARNGQVLSIDVDQGTVEAKVQGSRPTPYAIEINIKVLTSNGWDKVVEVLAGQALFAAKLLAGEMPQDIEKVFDDAGQSLFPQKLRDLETSCSCPDWSNPCKHIAAVYYLLGEEFDRDPFLLFKLRGMTREKLVASLQEVAQPAAASEAAPPAEAVAAPPATTEPLPADPRAYWFGGALPDDLYGEVQIPPASAALPKRLGAFPFWRGGERFLYAVQTVYRQASQQGLAAFRGERIH
jgi:uncharacterized Zn finger protein